MSAPLWAALDGLGLRYARRATDAGMEYAGFRLEARPGDWLGFTAAERGGAVQLTAHGVLGVPAAPEWMRALQAANRAWGTGKFHPAPGGGWDASTAVYAGAEPDADAMRWALHDLRAAAAAAREGEAEAAPGDGGTPEWFAGFAEGRRLDLPPADPAPLRQALARALEASGNPLRLDGGALRGAFRDGEHAFRVVVTCEPLWLALHAAPDEVPSLHPDDALRAAAALNARFAAGTVLADGAPPLPSVRVVQAAAWVEPDRAFAEWLMDRAAACTRAVAREWG